MENSKEEIKISGSLLAKNTIINIVGQVLPTLISFIFIPLVLKKIGEERFAVYSLMMAVLTYFMLLDLGLGKSMIKFIAEALGKGKKDTLNKIFWTIIIFQIMFSIVLSLLIIFLTPWLIETVLLIPSYLEVEVKNTFYLLSALLPLYIINASVRGFLGAKQQFFLINLIEIPSTSVAILSMFFFAQKGIDIAVLYIVIFKFCALLILFIACFKDTKSLLSVEISVGIGRDILKYSTWIFVHNAFGHLGVLIQNFLLTNLASLKQLTYYTIPNTITAKISTIPDGFLSTLFPALSYVSTKGKEELEKFYYSSLRLQGYIFLPIISFIFIFSEEILTIWLNETFAGNSTTVMRLLLIANYIGSLTNVAIALLQANNKPFLISIIVIIELPLFIITNWFVISNFGIVGAAAIFCLTIIINAFIFFWMVGTYQKIYLNRIFENKKTRILSMATFTIILLVGFVESLHLLYLKLIIFIIVIAGQFYGWKNFLSTQERTFLLKKIKFLSK